MAALGNVESEGCHLHLLAEFWGLFSGGGCGGFCARCPADFGGALFDCHGVEKQKSRLRLDSTVGILRGGESGEPLFVKGSSGESHLVKKVASKSVKEVMPPKGERLTPEQGLLFSSSLSRLTVSSFAPPYSYRHRW